MPYAGDPDYLRGFDEGRIRVLQHMEAAAAEPELSDLDRSKIAAVGSALDFWLGDPCRGTPHNGWRPEEHGIDARDAMSRSGAPLGRAHAISSACAIIGYAAEDFHLNGASAVENALLETAEGLNDDVMARGRPVRYARKFFMGEIAGEVKIRAMPMGVGATFATVVSDDDKEVVIRAAGKPAEALKALRLGERATFLVRASPRGLNLVDVKAEARSRTAVATMTR